MIRYLFVFLNIKIFLALMALISYHLGDLSLSVSLLTGVALTLFSVVLYALYPEPLVGVKQAVTEDAMIKMPEYRLCSL